MNSHQSCLEEAKNDASLDREWREEISSHLQGQKVKEQKEKLELQNEIKQQKFVSYLLEDSRFKFHSDAGTLTTVPKTKGVLQRVSRGEFQDFMEEDGSCKVCGQMFKHFYTFTQHYKEQHSSTHKQNFPCPICGKSFGRKSNMSRHTKTHK